jgi:hypothetical protein
MKASLKRTKPLSLCSSTSGGARLTPTKKAVETLARSTQLFQGSVEDVNAATMVARYDGTNQLWGGLDFADCTGCNVTDFFAETADERTHYLTDRGPHYEGLH